MLTLPCKLAVRVPAWPYNKPLPAASGVVAKGAFSWRKAAGSPPTVSLAGLAEYTSQRPLAALMAPAPAWLSKGPLPASMTTASPASALLSSAPLSSRTPPLPASCTLLPATTGASTTSVDATSCVASEMLPADSAPGVRLPVVCVRLMLEKPLPMAAPPLRAKLPLTVRLPVPPNTPPVRLKPPKPAAPLSVSEPPLTTAVPPPVTLPPSVAAPLPDTMKPPPSSVSPVTLSEPPDTLTELAALTVSDATVSVPLACCTAKPELMSAESPAPGSEPPQLAGVAQSRLPAALVKTRAPLLAKISRALSPAARL